jgi:RNA polymerase sigma-70 factor, ECF subfamily
VDITVSPQTVAPDDLLGRAQHGEAEAFRLLVDAHHAELVRVAYVVCGDLEVAREAAQAAWVKAWARLGGLREPDRLRHWLVAIAANEARQAVRARRRRAVREMAMPAGEVADGSASDGLGSAAGPTSDRLDLAQALARLDPEDRELIAMRYLAGLGSDEIAQATGRSASGVRARLSRLLSRLRTELSDA